MPQGTDAKTTGQDWRERALDRFYRSRPGWIDGTSLFQQLLGEHIARGSEILELGAGPSNPLTRFLAGFGPVTGLDVDPDVAHNDACTRAWVYEGTIMPADDASFDAVVSNYVAEHVEDPVALARECYRVLRPGGVLIFRTPNLWHYVSLIARLTPHSFHEQVALRAQNSGDEAHEPYPTFHRMNTRGACRRILEGAGFELVSLRCIEPEPSYGMFSRLAFYPMMAWERILNAVPALEPLRANILCVARKPASPPA